jgi:DNA-binding beta-propeller fold protein YncE
MVRASDPLSLIASAISMPPAAMPISWSTRPAARRTSKSSATAQAAHLVFDQSGNLYVGGDGVRVYAPTQKSWRMEVARTIHGGIDRPGPLAIGLSGDLFVGNEAGNSSVSIFAPGGSTPIRRITKGVAYPESLAIDSTGRLYVANSGPSSAPAGCRSTPLEARDRFAILSTKGYV